MAILARQLRAAAETEHTIGPDTGSSFVCVLNYVKRSKPAKPAALPQAVRSGIPQVS